MSTKKEAGSLGKATGSGRMMGANGRSLSQYTQPLATVQDFERYGRAVRRAAADAYVILKGFPFQIRFSYYVDRNGCLRCLTADKGGAR